MTDSAALTRPTAGLLPTQGDWQTMVHMAEVFVKSGLLPDAIKTPQAALLIIQKGRELGIQPTYALSNIAVIKGKPAASAELMLALIYRDHGDNAMRFRDSTAEECVALYKRRSWDKAESYSFTIQDARTAGLTNNQTWESYPAAMLRARCISAVARMAFPDSIGGMYTPGELGAHVSGEGDVEIVESEWAETAKPAQERQALPATAQPAAQSQDGDTRRTEPLPEEARKRAEVLRAEAAADASGAVTGEASEADQHLTEIARPANGEYKPATNNQVATVDKLSRLLGRTPDHGDLSADEASDMIRTLSAEYNARKTPAGARP